MALSLRSATSAHPSDSLASVVVVAGDLIIVAFSSQAGGPSTCSDNAAGSSNTYNEAIAQFVGTNKKAQMFYAVAKASETLTITCTTTTFDDGLSVHVVSGADQTLANVLDQSNKVQTSAGTSHTGASITNLVADSYMIAFWFQEAVVLTCTENAQGFGKQTEVTGHQHATFDQIVSATGTYNDAITTNVSATQGMGNIIASFKQAVASTPDSISSANITSSAGRFIGWTT